VLHLTRKDRRRFVHELMRVGRYNATRDDYEPETLFSNPSPIQTGGSS
jgi:hypothetical protein